MSVKLVGKGKKEKLVIYDPTTDNEGKGARGAFNDGLIKSYLIDFNARNTSIRTGIGYATILKHLKKPYTRNRIAEVTRKLAPGEIVQRGQVIARMWELANNPLVTDAGQVAATLGVAKMLGMLTAQDDTSRPSGVMLVPVIDVASWEETAEKSQLALKEKAANL